MRKNKTLKSFICLILFIWLVQSCKTNESKFKWKGTIEKKGNKIIVNNPSQPVIKDFKLSLEEQFILGNQKDENDIFYRVVSIALDSKENIYVLDSRDYCIKVFNPQGKFVKRIGRKGQGPGEFPESAFAMKITENDDIYILFPNNARIDKFNKQGIYKKSIEIPPFTGRFYIDSSENIFAETAIWNEKGERRRIIKVKNGMVKKEYASFKRVNPYQDYRMFRSDKGMLIYGRKHEYKFYISDDKNLDIEVNCDAPPVPYSKEERNEHFKNSQRRPPEFRFKRPPVKPFFSSIIMDDCGWIWIIRVSPYEGKYYCDIFDSQGRYIYQLLLDYAPDLIKNHFLYSVYEDVESGYLIKKFKMKNWPPYNPCS
ncbi:MAG: 6-bladed beta-propeller [Acidobacteriota bacterium]|nr:6-bladed beta-propeller [Acidobacteriota bacterium]